MYLQLLTFAYVRRHNWLCNIQHFLDCVKIVHTAQKSHWSQPNLYALVTYFILVTRFWKLWAIMGFEICHYFQINTSQHNALQKIGSKLKSYCAKHSKLCYWNKVSNKFWKAQRRPNGYSSNVIELKAFFFRRDFFI